MQRICFAGFALLLLLFLGNSSGNYAAASAKATAAEAQFKPSNSASQPARRSLDEGGIGTLQKMIVENGSVTMQLDLNRLNGTSSAGKPATLHFATAANSFFSILVFNDQLRGPEPGSIALIPSTGVNDPGYSLPMPLAASLKQLVVEKLSPDAPFDFAVRDAKSGFTFFKIEGHQYRLPSQRALA